MTLKLKNKETIKIFQGLGFLFMPEVLNSIQLYYL